MLTKTEIKMGKSEKISIPLTKIKQKETKTKNVKEI